MPNRIIKESICTSETIENLSWFEEVLFYRLIVNCDDYGRYDARPAILKGRLFPLKNVTISQIEDGLNKLSTVGIAKLYEVDGRPYLQLTTWGNHQQIRSKKSKFPSPEDNGYHMISDDIKCPRNPIQSESNSIRNPESETRVSAEEPEPTPLQEIYDLYNSICGEKLRKVTNAMNYQRERRVMVLWREYHDLSVFRKAFESAVGSAFLTSGGKSGWKADFDWIVMQDHFVNIIEGKYDNRKGNTSGRSASYDIDDFESMGVFDVPEVGS